MIRKPYNKLCSLLCSLPIWGGMGWGFVLIALASCTPTVPRDAEVVEVAAVVSPDIDGATLPPNIAPINLSVDEDGDECIVQLRAGASEHVSGGWQTDISVSRWHELLEAAKGDTLHINVFVRRGDRWTAYRTMHCPVALEEIDPYVTYRMIQPSYVCYEDLSIRQRDLTSFDETVLYDNRRTSLGDDGQCVNCHVVQDYNRTGRMQMHLRQRGGGTLLTDAQGRLVKLNLKTDSTLSAGVYPAWHPKRDLIAYSVNETGQVFHTEDVQKVEVIDYASDLILLDPAARRVYHIDCGADDFETFPAWSPEGDTLYYCSAHHVSGGDVEMDNDYQQLHYDLLRRPFDAETMRFGAVDTVYKASADSMSAVLPRVSPDGQWLLFTLAQYGNFHIWHRSADLYVKNLRTGAVSPLTEANSPESDSYHSWSSNGRWIVFSSRRDDGNYTRLYISYFDRNGHAHKAFAMPQRRPDYYTTLLLSYNVPELMVCPSPYDAAQLARAQKGAAEKVEYSGSLTPALPSREGTRRSSSRSERIEY